MRDRNEVESMLVERLGQGDPRQAVILLDKGKLLRIAEECQEMEVVKRRYGPWNEVDVTIILRLKGFEGESDPARMSRGVDLNGLLAHIRCRSLWMWPRLSGGAIKAGSRG